MPSASRRRRAHRDRPTPSAGRASRPRPPARPAAPASRRSSCRRPLRACRLRRRVCCSRFRRVTNVAVLDLAELQRVLRLDDRVGVQHVEDLGRGQAAARHRAPACACPAAGSAGRCASAVAAATPREPRRAAWNGSSASCSRPFQFVLSSRTSSARSSAGSSSAAALDRIQATAPPRLPAHRRNAVLRQSCARRAHASSSAA